VSSGHSTEKGHDESGGEDDEKIYTDDDLLKTESKICIRFQQAKIGNSEKKTCDESVVIESS
jgi:CRISPR/Cas system CMR-associated protein Cmr3 (group 5 of RAMP superfamily)